MTTSPRWGRLAADLTAIGIEVRVTERPYAESAYGRIKHGVSRGITLRHPSGGLVEIRDKWWRKNPDVWIGWQVDVENREGIEVRYWPITKKRSEVVAAVRDAMGIERVRMSTAAEANHITWETIDGETYGYFDRDQNDAVIEITITGRIRQPMWTTGTNERAWRVNDEGNETIGQGYGLRNAKRNSLKALNDYLAKSTVVLG